MIGQLAILSTDDPGLSSQLARQATQAGVHLTPVQSKNVLEAARSQRVGLIIIDAQQAFDARLVLARLRLDPLTRSVPIIMVSDPSDERVQRFFQQRWAASVEMKPVSSTLMLRARRSLEASASVGAGLGEAR